jgi:hypothetical protein
MELSDKYSDLVIDGWLYLSPDMILEDMKYKRVSDFYSVTLRPNYIEGIDYIDINKTDDLVLKYKEYKGEPVFKKATHTGGKPQKYYKITLITLNRMYVKRHRHKKIKPNIQECDISNKLSKLIIGRREVTIPYSGIRIDILSQTHIVEVKRFKSRMAAVGQVL